MRFSIMGFFVLVAFGFFAGAAQSGTKTDLEVFQYMVSRGVPVSEAVSGVVANSPNSVVEVVDAALSQKPNEVYAITLAALNASPESYSEVIRTVIEDYAANSADILQAVSKHDINKVANTVNLLIANNSSQKDNYINQAADALLNLHLAKNPHIAADKIRKSL